MSHISRWYPHYYFSGGNSWDTDKITDIPPMNLTDDRSDRGSTRESLQIVSIKIASIRGGLRWPIDVYGMVTVRDVLDNRMRNIIFARTRRNCQTITEEHPYLTLTGPTRAVVTCLDPGNIEIVLKVKGTTEADDRDFSFVVLTLKISMYCSFDERSTLQLGFHHIESALEATISVRLISGSSLPPVGFQGVFTASTSSIDDVEVMLLDFRDGKLPITGNGMINLSRRVVSVRKSKKDQLKVSIMARCDKEDGQAAARDDIVFTPKKYGRSCGVLNIDTCKMQVTVAWSLFDY
ncbi:unnamed protein product [Alopecurus aequalis]